MKQILKYLGLLLLAAILFILIAGLFIAKDYHFERSITINAPREKVWEQVNNFTSRNKWNPWAEYDPGMQHTIEGTDEQLALYTNGKEIKRWEAAVKPLL